MPVSIWTFKQRLPKASQTFVDGTDVRRCPVCGRAFVMQQSLSGKTIRCRGCRNMFVVESDHDACESLVNPRSPNLATPAEAESANMGGRAARPVYSEDIGDDLEDGDSGEQCPAAVPSPRQLRPDENPTGVAASVAAVALGGLTALPSGRMAREQEAGLPAVLRRRPGNQAAKATSKEERLDSRSSFDRSACQ